MREALISDAAVFLSRKKKDVNLARQWLADLPQVTKMPGLRVRAEAAILQAQDDIEGALRKLEEYEQAILTVANQVQRDLALRGLRKWRSELEPQLQPSLHD